MKLSKCAVALFFAVLAAVPGCLQGQTFTVLHNFGATGDGNNPSPSLAFDSSGNLFGTTQAGGSNDLGTVFELQATQGWNEILVHSFAGTDGCRPMAPVTFDQHGNILATTNACPGLEGGGSVNELMPDGGNWLQMVRHVFAGSVTTPSHPRGGITLDPTGHLFGTTEQGGQYGGGAVYTLGAGGSAVTKVLHAFGNGNDGRDLIGNLVMDAQGNLYGTTSHGGGSRNAGIVYELSPNGSGRWTESILHTFQWSTTDGGFPQDGLILDASGNLYGTTQMGGALGWGTVFKLSSNGNGTWTQTVLYSFQGGSDGELPNAGLTMDSAGNLYGTTYAGGGQRSQGTVYKLTPGAGGTWSETVLHSFVDFSGGWSPFSRVVVDNSGNVYGTTGIGGTNGGGVVYQIAQ